MDWAWKEKNDMCSLSNYIVGKQTFYRVYGLSHPGELCHLLRTPVGGGHHVDHLGGSLKKYKLKISGKY